MNYDFSIDKKKPLTVSRFKQSPKHGGEYREVENILSKRNFQKKYTSVFYGEINPLKEGERGGEALSCSQLFD